MLRFEVLLRDAGSFDSARLRLTPLRMTVRESRSFALLRTTMRESRSFAQDDKI